MRLSPSSHLRHIDNNASSDIIHRAFFLRVIFAFRKRGQEPGALRGSDSEFPKDALVGGFLRDEGGGEFRYLRDFNAFVIAFQCRVEDDLYLLRVVDHAEGLFEENEIAGNYRAHGAKIGGDGAPGRSEGSGEPGRGADRANGLQSEGFLGLGLPFIARAEGAFGFLLCGGLARATGGQLGPPKSMGILAIRKEDKIYAVHRNGSCFHERGYGLSTVAS